jgi:hypothetical protein
LFPPNVLGGHEGQGLGALTCRSLGRRY